MTRARDLADSADKDIAGTLTLDAVNASGVITGLTVEATGDTAAGDNAAMGYTAAEGLILTGQGSTNDVTIKNDADADVIEIPTGTTNVTMAGTLGVTGVVTANAGVVVDELTLDADTITATDDFKIDAAADISLDANGGNINFFDDGTAILTLANSSTDAVIQSRASDRDLIFKGNDGGSPITALTLDMSNAGEATFNGAAKIKGVNLAHPGAAAIVIGQDSSSLSQIRVYGTNDSTLGTLAIEATTSGGSTSKTLLSMTESVADFNPSALNIDFRVRSDSNDNMLFVDASTDSVLIGTTNNSQVVGTGLKSVLSNSNARHFVVGADASSGEGYSLYAQGAYRFYVAYSGSIFSTSTSITSISDERLKENIVDLETGLTEIMALKPRRFDWKNGDGKNIAGFIAQEVETVLPDLIGGFKHDELDDAKSLKMGDVIPTLVKAIQEQQTLIKTLTDRVTALES